MSVKHPTIAAGDLSTEAAIEAILRQTPMPDDAALVIRFANRRGIDFLNLLSMIPNAFKSRANSIMVPGNRSDPAMPPTRRCRSCT